MKYNNIIVNMNTDIRTSAKKIDSGGIGLICVVDDNMKLIGIVTDGDFRRAILNGVSLDDNVLMITNKIIFQ